MAGFSKKYFLVLLAAPIMATMTSGAVQAAASNSCSSVQERTCPDGTVVSCTQKCPKKSSSSTSSTYHVLDMGTNASRKKNRSHKRPGWRPKK